MKKAFLLLEASIFIALFIAFITLFYSFLSNNIKNSIDVKNKNEMLNSCINSIEYFYTKNKKPKFKNINNKKIKTKFKIKLVNNNDEFIYIRHKLNLNKKFNYKIRIIA